MLKFEKKKSVTKRLMQCSYILAVYRETCAEHTVCVRSSEAFSVTVGGTYVVIFNVAPAVG